MEIFNKYKSGSYNNKFNSQLFMVGWESKESREKLATFNKNKHITLSASDIDKVISEVNRLNLDKDLNVKVVVQKADFDKERLSINSGVTTKLAFLMRDVVDEEITWKIYGLASGLFNSKTILNVDRSHKLGFSTYISIYEKDASASNTIETFMDRILRIRASKQNQADA